MRGGRGASVDASSDAAEFSSPLTPPPPSFALRATGGPPPPLSRGRMQAFSFSRCGPHPSHRHAVRISSLSAPIFARECRRWSPVSSRSVFRATKCKNGRKARKRNADRRVANGRTLRVRRAQSAARSPLGVPPRLLPEGLRSPRLSFRPGFLGRGFPGRYPVSPVPVQWQHPTHRS